MRGCPDLKRIHRVEGERRIASRKTWDVLSQESLLRGEPPRKFTEICLGRFVSFPHTGENKKGYIRIGEAHLVRIWEREDKKYFKARPACQGDRDGSLSHRDRKETLEPAKPVGPSNFKPDANAQASRP